LWTARERPALEKGLLEEEACLRRRPALEKGLLEEEACVGEGAAWEGAA
jgi:hypothetical protein